MVSDYYTGANRSKALSLFLLAMNGGRALGIPIGGWLAVSYGWQTPFRVMAGVGLLLGLLGLKLLFEPKAAKEIQAEMAPVTISHTGAVHALVSKSYVCVVLGLAMENFVLGGLAVWLPTYLYRFAGYSVGRATGVLGIITLACGIGGTWLGGVTGSWLLLRDRRALHWMSAACFLMTVPCVVGILTHSRPVILCGVVGSQLLLFCNLAPLNTVLLNSAPEAVRSMAVAIALFVIHALGDAISPRLVGVISDAHGLRAGLSITIIALLIGATLMLAGTSQSRPQKSERI
jgi:predicted MFS family arabinose efflux permease